MQALTHNVPEVSSDKRAAQPRPLVSSTWSEIVARSASIQTDRTLADGAVELHQVGVLSHRESNEQRTRDRQQGPHLSLLSRPGVVEIFVKKNQDPAEKCGQDGDSLQDRGRGNIKKSGPSGNVWQVVSRY